MGLWPTPVPVEVRIPAAIKPLDNFSERFGEQVFEYARGVALQYEQLVSKEQEQLRVTIATLQNENTKLQMALEKATLVEPIPPSVFGTVTASGMHDQIVKADMIDVMSGSEGNLAFLTPEVSWIKKEDGIIEIFQELDSTGIGHISAEQLVNIATGELVPVESDVHNTEKAIAALNSVLPQLSLANDPCRLSLAGFEWIMLADQLDAVLNSEDANALADIRDRCVNRRAVTAISKKSMVRTQDLTDKDPHQKRAILEPMSVIVILLNALVIGMSLDVEQNWPGWQILEVFFTVFFVGELATKIYHEGLMEAYLGCSWQWNVFDSIVVAAALADMVCYVLEAANVTGTIELQNLTVLRLVRLLRIMRVLRLLKFRAFKDLNMMVNGVLGGMKTLFWALMLIVTMVYIFGVMMRQLMTEPPKCDGCSPNEQKAIDHIVGFGDELFGSVTRSMFTVFRCFTDGCSSMDGTPLVLWFWDAYGPLFVLCYTLFTVFMLFGVFNLIQAVFIEKTLEYAKVENGRRHEARYRENIRVAKELQKVVLRIFSYHQLPDVLVKGRQQKKHQGGLMSVWSKSGSRIDNEAVPCQQLQMSVGREDFERVMDDPEIRTLLEDLEICVSSSSKLFDILDSDNSGALNVEELVEGLMKLRGPADKGDVISSSLTARAVQLTLKSMQQDQEKFNRLVLKALDELRGYRQRGSKES